MLILFTVNTILWKKKYIHKKKFADSLEVAVPHIKTLKHNQSQSRHKCTDELKNFSAKHTKTYSKLLLKNMSRQNNCFNSRTLFAQKVLENNSHSRWAKHAMCQFLIEKQKHCCHLLSFSKSPFDLILPWSLLEHAKKEHRFGGVFFFHSLRWPIFFFSRTIGDTQWMESSNLVWNTLNHSYLPNTQICIRDVLRTNVFQFEKQSPQTQRLCACYFALCKYFLSSFIRSSECTNNSQVFCWFFFVVVHCWYVVGLRLQYLLSRHPYSWTEFCKQCAFATLKLTSFCFRLKQMKL